MDPYAALLHQVERLNETFQSLLPTHATLKRQNDEILVRVGMEQQYALNPVMKGKRLEDEGRKAGVEDGAFAGEEGNGAEAVGLVGAASRR